MPPTGVVGLDREVVPAVRATCGDGAGVLCSKGCTLAEKGPTSERIFVSTVIGERVRAREETPFWSARTCWG